MLKRWNKFFYRNSRIGADPDSSWKLQNEQMKTNAVYKLIDFGGGGRLMEKYDEGGINEDPGAKKTRIWEFAESEIKPNFLLENVLPISEREYKEYLAKQQNMSKAYIHHKEAIVVDFFDHDDEQPGSANASTVTIDSVLSRYADERCFWRLDKRGAVGETALHMLFVNNTPKSLDVARMLLELYPGLAADAYMGIDYFGETCLHFAIINNSMKAFKILLNTGHCDVHARARGKFFVPVDIKLGAETLKSVNYDGLAYYGEYPLSFAASVGNYEMYDILLRKGADLTRKDKFGNTALHMTVVHNKVDMYHHAVSHAICPADPSVENKNGLTPMALAAFLGRSEMFKAIIDISAKKYWAYSRMICNAYPLRHLDTIAPNGDTNWNSGLMRIIKGDHDSHLDMLEGGVVTQLLNQKWKKFARVKYIRLFVYYVFHIIFLSCSVYLRPFDVNDLLGPTDAVNIARYVFEILTCLGSAVALFYALREIWIETFRGFIQNIKTVPSRLLYYFGCILLLMCIPFRIARMVDVEDWLLTFAIPFTWSYFLFFARGLALTGPFVTMIYKMIKTDILRFSFIYVIIIGTSGVVFFYQYKDLNVFAFLSELGTFMTLLQMSLGEFDYDAVRSGRYPALSITLFIIFMLMVHVLLLSMLIAMMTRTYERIAAKTQKEWRRQWASIVIILERSYSNEDKLNFQRKYSVEMNVRRMTSEGPAGENVSSDLEESERGLHWIHDRGVGSGERKAAIVGRWKKTGEKAVKEGNLSSDSDDVIKIMPPRKSMHARSDDDIPHPSVLARRRLDAELTMHDDTIPAGTSAI